MKKYPKKIKKEQIIILLLIVYVFSMCFYLSSKLQFSGYLDEDMKYELIDYLVKYHRLPHGGDAKIRNVEWGTSYAFTPYVPYIISSFFIRIVLHFTTNIRYLLLAGRFVSVICITLYTFIVVKIAEELFHGLYKWFFIELNTLFPSVLYLGSYTNCDSFALLCISIVFFAWVLGLKTNWNKKSCFLLSLGVGLCFLSYYNAYGYILCSVFLYFFSNIFYKNNCKLIIKKGLCIFSVVFLLCGWWFIRQYIIYDGDIFGLKTSTKYEEKYADEKHRPSQRGTPYQKNYSLNQMLINMKWLNVTHRSFIVPQKINDILTQTMIFNIYHFIILVGILSFAIYTKRNNNFELLFTNILNSSSQKKLKIMWRVIIVISILIPISLSLYYSYFCDYQPQGRYIIPALVPFMYIITLGYQKLFTLLIRTPSNGRSLSILILGTLWLLPIYIYVFMK